MMQEEMLKLSSKTKDMRRAIDSLREELEAVDYYNQRADSCSNKELKKILLHNAKEEKEHAAMLIEWIRQNDKEFAYELKDYLFMKNKDITAHENH
ncbi:MAG: ferritin family protein [archaeon]